ncbi:MAG: C_GCAxxG_C_C family protein [Clostridia bacterium]|nr:C_GCAxxG_C_C family protein [Clostridia bacterium]
MMNNTNKADRAVELFSGGFNCSQAVLTAFASDFGLSEELTLKLGSEFGSGARNGELCGAVSGALLVLGLKYGHCNSADTERKMRAYAIADEFTRRFREVNGSIVCRELLGYDLTNPEDMAVISEKNLFREFCPLMVKSAVKVLESILSEYE